MLGQQRFGLPFCAGLTRFQQPVNRYGFRIAGGVAGCTTDTEPPVINLFRRRIGYRGMRRYVYGAGFQSSDNCDGDITWAVSVNI